MPAMPMPAGGTPVPTGPVAPGAGVAPTMPTALGASAGQFAPARTAPGTPVPPAPRERRIGLWIAGGLIVAAAEIAIVGTGGGGARMVGAIKPGADKVHKRQATLPASETAHDTMLVLALSEGNGAAPRNASRRIPIEPSTAAPVLAMRCAIVGHEAARPDLDAGQNLMVRCQVENTGNAEARQVNLDAAIGDGAQGHSAPQPVPAAGRATIDVAITVPRGLPINAPVEIAITARDRASSRSARATVVGVVRKPRLCEPGQLTRAQYQAKIAELRSAVTAGDITQAQFDRYDAELVACLK